MAWLEQAVAAGFNEAERLKSSKDLTDLHNRADFQNLVAKLTMSR